MIDKEKFRVAKLCFCISEIDFKSFFWYSLSKSDMSKKICTIIKRLSVIFQASIVYWMSTKLSSRTPSYVYYAHSSQHPTATTTVVTNRIRVAGGRWPALEVDVRGLLRADQARGRQRRRRLRPQQAQPAGYHHASWLGTVARNGHGRIIMNGKVMFTKRKKISIYTN